MANSPTLLTDVEAADFLGLSRLTLRNWRYKGRGPRFCKLGGAVRYDRTTLEAWLAAQERCSTSDTGVAA